MSPDHRSPARVSRAWLLLDALVIVGVLPVFWFPLRWPLLTLAVLPVLPVTWLVWRRRTGRLSSGGLERPLLALLLCTCLTALPVFAADLAAPKLLGIAIGAAVMLSAQRAAQSCADAGRVISGLAVLTIGVALVGAVGAEWPSGKLPVLESVLSRAPALIRGVVPHTTQGGVNPNELAGVLTLVVPLLFTSTLVAADRGGSWRSWFVRAGATLLGGLALAASQSRGALLGTGVACALVLTVLPGSGVLKRVPSQWSRGAAAISWVVVIGAASWGLRGLVRGGTPATAGNVSETLAGRAEIWRTAAAMVWDFPVTGIGLGQFDPVLHWLYPPRLLATEFVPHAHNMYLAYAVELGIPGALSMAWLLVVFFRQSRRAARGADGSRRVLGVGLAAGMVAFLIFGITDAISPGARGGLLLWLVLGLGAGSPLPLVARSQTTPTAAPSAFAAVSSPRH